MLPAIEISLMGFSNSVYFCTSLASCPKDYTVLKLVIASPQSKSDSMVSFPVPVERPAENLVCKIFPIANTGARPSITSDSYQQNQKPMRSEKTSAKPPSNMGPKLSEPTPFITDVSAAIMELKTPTEFSLLSNQPMFFYKMLP